MFALQAFRRKLHVVEIKLIAFGRSSWKKIVLSQFANDAQYVAVGAIGLFTLDASDAHDAPNSVLDARVR